MFEHRQAPPSYTVVTGISCSQLKFGTAFPHSAYKDAGRLVGIAALMSTMLFTLAAACGETPPRTGAESEVRGMVQAVEPRSLLDIESLTVVDEQGVVWTFQGGPLTPAGFTPSHLREHMLLGEPVSVFYHAEGDALVIDDITD